MLLLRFLVVGGLVVLFNLAIRRLLFGMLPFTVAVSASGVLTLVVGFFAYRRFVFHDTRPITLRTIALYLAAQGVGLAVTVAVAALAVSALAGSLVTPRVAEFLAHGIGIVAGAAATFPLYRWLTFRQAP